jgi:molybdopterin synthase sulfur carrier subunit
MIEVRYFAGVREALGRDREHLPLPDGVSDVDGLIRALVEVRGEAWREALCQDNLLVAVNQTMVKGSQVLRDGDEVAFFPPVSGG